MQPNNSFKPNPLRGFWPKPESLGRVGLIQVLGLMHSASDVRVVREALNAAAQGPFFPDWEFPTLFGLERGVIAALAESFSASTPLTPDLAAALRSTVNNLLGYPHGQDAAWLQWVSVSPSELEVIFRRVSEHEA